MPIDPKKFKKVITNHFDNLTEEEFLKTLRKSSPHLFDESSEEKQATWQINQTKIPLDSSSQKISSSISHQKKYFWGRAIIVMGGVLFGSSVVPFLTINILKPSNASQVFTSKDKFQCNVSRDSVVLQVKIGTVSRPFIKFVGNFTGNSKINRCKTISSNFTRYTEQSGLYVSTGIRNGRSILCASNKNGECIKDDNGGELLSLSPDVDPKKYLQLLFELNRNNLLNSSPIFTQSQDLIYLE
jgi:Circadian oscillating protein COP23